MSIYVYVYSRTWKKCAMVYVYCNQSFRVACLRLDVFSYTLIRFFTITLSFGCHGNSLHIVRVFVCYILTHGIFSCH